MKNYADVEAKLKDIRNVISNSRIERKKKLDEEFKTLKDKTILTESEMENVHRNIQKEEGKEWGVGFLGDGVKGQKGIWYTCEQDLVDEGIMNEAEESGVYDGSHPGSGNHIGSGVSPADFVSLLGALGMEISCMYPDPVSEDGEFTLPKELSYREINDIKRRIISAIDEMIES